MATEITVNPPLIVRPSMLARNIPDQTYFTGVIGSYGARLFLKTFGVVVAIDGKGGTLWPPGFPGDPLNLEIQDYRPITKVFISYSYGI